MESIDNTSLFKTKSLMLEPLEESEATRYRAIAARANYLAADRPDIMYSVKEICRGMANPTRAHWHKLKRFGRYLVGSGLTVMKYDWQGHERERLRVTLILIGQGAG